MVGCVGGWMCRYVGCVGVWDVCHLYGVCALDLIRVLQCVRECVWAYFSVFTRQYLCATFLKHTMAIILISSAISLFASTSCVRVSTCYWTQSIWPGEFFVVDCAGATTYIKEGAIARRCLPCSQLILSNPSTHIM